MRFNTLILYLFVSLINAQSSSTDSTSTTLAGINNGTNLIVPADNSSISDSQTPITMIDLSATNIFGSGMITDVTFTPTPTTDEVFTIAPTTNVIFTSTLIMGDPSLSSTSISTDRIISTPNSVSVSVFNSISIDGTVSTLTADDSIPSSILTEDSVSISTSTTADDTASTSTSAATDNTKSNLTSSGSISINSNHNSTDSSSGSSSSNSSSNLTDSPYTKSSTYTLTTTIKSSISTTNIVVSSNSYGFTLKCNYFISFLITIIIGYLIN